MTFLYRPTERCREKVNLSACRGRSHIHILYDNVPPTTRHYLLTFVNCVLRQQQVHQRDQRERVTAIKNFHISQPAKLSIRTLPSHMPRHMQCVLVCTIAFAQVYVNLRFFTRLSSEPCYYTQKQTTKQLDTQNQHAK